METQRTASPRPIAVTVGDAAGMLGVSEETIRRRIAAGEIPATRIGASVRIRVAALEEFALAHEQRTAPHPEREPGVVYTTRGRRIG